MNIVQMILNLLSGSDAIGRIAPLLGISQDQAGKAVNAAVPSVLAGLLGTASKPGGGAEISNTLQRQSPGILDNLSGLFSGNTDTIASQGTNLLSSLLGGGGLSQISSVLARFTGLSEGITGKLLGMIAPVILGVLGKQTRGMDGAGITNFLAGQKENIQAAMPSGLSSMLASAVPGLGSVLGSTAPRTSVTSTPSYDSSRVDRSDRTTEPTGTPHREGGDWWKWAIPLILAALVLYFVPKMFRGTREAPPVGEQRTTEGTPGLTEERVSTEGVNLLYSANDQISSITNEATAAAALPKLRDTTEKIGGFRALLARLPEPAQKGVLNTLRPVAERLRKTATPVLALPVVGAQVKPTIDELFSQIDKLFSTPEIVAPPAPAAG